MHTHMHAFMISFRKVFVNPNFDDPSLVFLGCYKPSPLKQNLVPRFEKGRKDYPRFEEIGKLRLDVIFALPSSFLFCVVAPLNLEKLDASGSDRSKSFFQNADGYFGIGQ